MTTSGSIHPKIAVLFDEELRVAAAALHRAVEASRDKSASEEEKGRRFLEALYAGAGALWTVTDDVDAIVVIDAAASFGCTSPGAKPKGAGS